MLKQTLLFSLALAMALPAMGASVFVGSYRVDSGPHWGSNPLSYTAQEGAAIVFGGVAADYSISTNSDMVDPNTITHTGWYSIWGISGGTEFAETFKVQTGSGYNDPGGHNSAISAYVDDNATGPQYTNYVWTSDAAPGVPEPATFFVLGSGLVAFAATRRRRAR